MSHTVTLDDMFFPHDEHGHCSLLSIPHLCPAAVVTKSTPENGAQQLHHLLLFE